MYWKLERPSLVSADVKAQIISQNDLDGFSEKSIDSNKNYWFTYVKVKIIGVLLLFILIYFFQIPSSTAKNGRYQGVFQIFV